MKRQTRKLLLNVATGVALAATAAVMLMPSTASAQPTVGVQIGPGGPSVSIGVDDGSEVEVVDGAVCFYARTRFRGESFCAEEGTTIRNLRDWSNQISSFDNEEGLEVTVCTRPNLRGQCRSYTSGARSLGALDDNIRSIRVE